MLPLAPFCKDVLVCFFLIFPFVWFCLFCSMHDFLGSYKVIFHWSFVCLSLCLCVCVELSLQAGETIFSNDCSEKSTCHPSNQLIHVKNSCGLGETCMLTAKGYGCIRQEGHCTLSPETWFSSFDGVQGKLITSGVYKLASYCDEDSPSWFKLVVDINDCNDDMVPAATAIYLFFREAFITVTNFKETWVSCCPQWVMWSPISIFPSQLSMSKLNGGS